MGILFGKKQEVTVPMDQEVAEPNMLDPNNPDVQSMLLSGQREIGKEEIIRARNILESYKQGKANLESRVVKDELWWELRHWEAIGRDKNKDQAKPTSAWLFNSILNKHADFMDNFPEPVVLPREQSDIDSAKTLTSVLPCIFEENNFEETYSNNVWEKLKHGTACYGVFWDPTKENGLGDIDIKQLDLLKIFWEPGITDIQKSQNLFIVDLVDTELLDEKYPEYKGQMGGKTIDVAQYVHDDTIDTSKKSVVVDWYYKVKNPNGMTVVHYAKFVDDVLLYASENDPDYQYTGFYSHGMYPVVFDTLFPEKGTPVGFGYVAICKDPQLYIDQLSGNILENSMMNTKKRYFMSESTNVNEDEFIDWNKPIVHVAGEINDNKIKEIVGNDLSPVYLSVMQEKIEEMKDTAANRDVNSGGVGSGVTAAAAIAALQEAGNKASRDMIAGTYRSHTQIVKLCIEVMRQFYQESRSFRITAPNGPDGYDFVSFDNSMLVDQPIMGANGMPMLDGNGANLYRKPVFDLKIKSQKQNPFSRMEQNEYAKEFYSMGFFDPARAQEATIALSMMDFEGIEEIRQQIAQGQTLYNVLQGLLGQAGMTQPMGAEPQPQMNTAAPSDMPASMTGYGQQLAERSMPSMDNLGVGASI